MTPLRRFASSPQRGDRTDGLAKPDPWCGLTWHLLWLRSWFDGMPTFFDWVFV